MTIYHRSDREIFARKITETLENTENIEIIREELLEIPCHWETECLYKTPRLKRKEEKNKTE